MAVVYRSEKKKILRSQINIVQKVIQVLTRVEDVLAPENKGKSDIDQAYQKLILEPTEIEQEWCKQIQENADMSEAEKAIELTKLEEYFYYRRIINSTYFKQLKTLILAGDY